MTRRFGDYTVLRRLGSGGFGSVYLAEAPDGVTVAVKVLHDHQDSMARALFRRELEAAQRVDTRHVAQVHDYDLVADPPWIAFRAAGTRTLMEAVRADQISILETLQALLGAAKGLAAMHAAGLTHRDVSPDNILVTPGDGMLIDLGLATLGAGTRYSEMLAGKLAHLAPEQWTSSVVMPASDVWQWGVTATKALSGRLPFPPAGSPHEQQQLAAQQEPDLSGLGVARDLVTACLQKTPEDRPTAVGLVDSLVALVAEEVDRERRYPKGLPDDRSAVQVLSGEAITTVTELQVSGDGRLRAQAVVPEMTHAAGVVTPWRSNAGDVEVMIGDRIAIGWDARGRLHLGKLLTSLRTGAESSPQLPTRCSACGAPFEPFYGEGWRCPNEQHCPALVEPRIDQHLALAIKMRHERLDLNRRRRRLAVVRQLLRRGLVRNEGDLYEPSDEAVLEAVTGLPEETVWEFLEDRRLSRDRPFRSTVGLIPRVKDWDARTLVKSLPTLELLMAASVDDLHKALVESRDYSGRSPLFADMSPEAAERAREEKHRLAEQVHGWFRVPWHIQVLRQLEACGVKMRHEQDKTPPPRRPPPSRTTP